MKTYIALLRGINVGGVKILMADLKTLMESLQFEEVRTYIQTGNTIFRTKKTAPGKLAGIIEKKIKEQFGYDISVFITDPAELKELIEANPFLGRKDVNIDRVYLALIAAAPDRQLLEAFTKMDYGEEEFAIAGKALYFYTPASFSDSVFNNNFFEQKLKIRATTRNLRTMNKLLELADK